MTLHNTMRIRSFLHAVRERRHFLLTGIRTGFLALLSVSFIGCSALDVNDPTKFRVEYVSNQFGATAAVSGVRNKFMQALQEAALEGGRMTDEFIDFTNQNSRLANMGAGHSVYGRWQSAYSLATADLPLVRKYSPESQHGAQVGEMLALRGYILLNLGEHMCSGFPVIQLDVDGETMVPNYTSAPQTADSVFVRAIAEFDSALAITSPDSARVRSFAQIGRGRALLGLGRFAEAQAAVTGVETDYTYSLASQFVLYYPFSTDYGGETSVSDREGINGLDYVSSHDPRVEINISVSWNGDTLWAPAKYMSGVFAPIVVANGIEARLIEAEGQLATDPTGSAWLTTVNALRATVALADTTNPGTTVGRTDLLFRERAFWLFGTGHRLGDLRRLVTQYGRDPETVFPTGALHYRSYNTTYGTRTSLQFNGVSEHAFYPKITGCTSE